MMHVSFDIAKVEFQPSSSEVAKRTLCGLMPIVPIIIERLKTPSHLVHIPSPGQQVIDFCSFRLRLFFNSWLSARLHRMGKN